MLDNDRATIKLTDTKQSDNGTKTLGLTAKQDSQLKEVLFFANAHFLFFNFTADAHLAHCLLPAHAQIKQKGKNQRTKFCQRNIYCPEQFKVNFFNNHET